MSWTVEQWCDLLMQDMQWGDEGSGVTGGQGIGSIGPQIYAPSQQSLTEMCAGPNVYNRTGGNLHQTCDSQVFWAWAWEVSGNGASQTRHWIGELEIYLLLDSVDGEWRRVVSNNQPSGYVNGSGAATQGQRGDQIQHAGTAYASVKTGSLTPIELWAQPFYPFVDRALMARVRGVHCRARHFVIGSDAASSKYGLRVGYDPYKANSGLTDAFRPPDGFPSRAMDGGHGRRRVATEQPSWVTCTTVGPTGVITGSRPPWNGTGAINGSSPEYGSSYGPDWPWAKTPYLLTEAQLRANPPPRPYELGGPYVYDHYQPGQAPAPAPTPAPTPTPAPGPNPTPAPPPAEPPGPIPAEVVDANNWFALDVDGTDDAWAPLGEASVVDIDVTNDLVVAVGETLESVLQCYTSGGYVAPDRSVTSVTVSPGSLATITAASTTDGIGRLFLEIEGDQLGVGTVTVEIDGYSESFGLSVVTPDQVPANLSIRASAWSRAITR